MRNVRVEPVVVSEAAAPEQHVKNEAAQRLIREWLADESGYDEATWPVARRAIEDHRLSPRPRFDGSIFLLHAGPLGRIAHPHANRELVAWLDGLLAANVMVMVPEIADY
jgi:hypothetical protein